VKPSKVQRGRNFVEALHDRYVSIDAPEIAPQKVLPDAFVRTSNGKFKSIELVGEKKIR